MKSWFENKTVAIVGNSLSLFSKTYGKEIDDHDIVVRLNKAAMLYTHFDSILSHGTKTDVWMIWSIHEYRKEIETSKVDKIMHMSYIGRHNKNFKYKKIEFYNVDMFMELRKKTGKHQNPSTGLMALDYVYRCSPKRIDLYGFDWKETPTFTDVNGEYEKKCFHNFDVEKKLCFNEYLNRENITLWK